MDFLEELSPPDAWAEQDVRLLQVRRSYSRGDRLPVPPRGRLVLLDYKTDQILRTGEGLHAAENTVFNWSCTAKALEVFWASL